MSNLIEPHGGMGLTCCLLEGAELEAEKKKAESLKKISISPREKGDLIMMGIGGFSPLTGFMTKADWRGVCDNFLIADGTFWPIPVTLSASKEDADGITDGDEIALYDPEGEEIMATMKVTEKYEMTEAGKLYECEKVYMGEGTATAEEFWRIAMDDHPGVQMVMEQKEINLAGPVKVLSEGEYPTRYAGVYMRPEESRKIFEELGWSEVAALQLRGPMHRSHEYLCKIAVEVCDGVFIHSLVGNLKPGDIPASVRVKCIDALVKNYFVPGKVVQGGYPLDMRYAGPREGLLHATFRQNYGCSRMIIGRDHAGVGDFYGFFEAQTIFDKIPTPKEKGKALLCTPLKIDWTFYCYKCDGMASLRTCPHERNDRVLLSGTMQRKMLSEGGELPDHFGRDEVIEILREYYEGLTDKVEIKLHAAACGGENYGAVTPKIKELKRYFATRIEGGPEAIGKHPRLLLGNRYDCVLGIETEAYPTGIAEMIPPETLAKMRGREVLVMARGEGLEIRNKCVPLKIGPDYTSTEEAVNFNALRPGPCNLQLRLLLDCNRVSSIRYDFVAVQRSDRIINGPPADQKAELGPAEYLNRLRKNELHIWVSRLGSKLNLNAIWGGGRNAELTFMDQTRADIYKAKGEFLSRYYKYDYQKPVKLRRRDLKIFMEDLKKVGDIIFNRLFVQGGAPKFGEEIREILRSNCPAPIQIQTSDEYLPWMFISDGEGALGLRHGVEYILDLDELRNVPLELANKPLRIVYAVAPVFKAQKVEDGRSAIDIQEEAQAMLTGDRFEVSSAYDEEHLLQEMSKPADVIYAYCHGGMGIGPIPDPCIWMTAKDKNISGSTVTDSKSISWNRNPLVILAACTSGAIDPFRAMGMAKNFLAKGARGYIATEGMVPATFASIFTKDFFEEFFLKGEKPVGDVLFGLRNRYLDEMNNPWGILFTQFCRSEITVHNT